jgi:hypothetical protein
MRAIKKSSVIVKSVDNSLAYEIIIAMARVNGDTNHQLYRDRNGLKNC